LLHWIHIIFQLLCFWITTTIENPIHFFIPFQIHLEIIFTLKKRYFQFDNIWIIIYIIMSSEVMKISLLAELAPSSIPKIPLVSRLSKTTPTTIVWFWFSHNLPHIPGTCTSFITMFFHLLSLSHTFLITKFTISSSSLRLEFGTLHHPQEGVVCYSDMTWLYL